MSYTQNNEESFILEYFNGAAGTLLDIGANDGKTLSNSLALVERGWVGTFVEASPKAWDRLRNLYGFGGPLQIINVAVGSYDGEIEFNESGELLGTGDIALVSSTRQDEMDRWVSLNMPFNKVTVPCVTFKTLLERSLYSQFDFLTIDIEGMEPEVVPQIDFTSLGIRMAIVEWNGKFADLYDGILINHGLKLIHTNAENRIYVR